MINDIRFDDIRFDDIVMINDERVVAIEILDNGEPLVDVREVGLRVAEDHPQATSNAPSRFSCRSSVAERLVAANAALPNGFELSLAEGHRPIEIQTESWERNLHSLMERQPELTEEQAAIETAKFIAPPWSNPPHSTGGAVDVIIMRGEDEVPMGCMLDEQCDAMRTKYRPLEPAHVENRRMLLEVMESAGFVNYGHEWWHFSYGDRYWAYQTKAPTAIFATV